MLVLVPIGPHIKRLKNSVLGLVHKILKNLILKNVDLVLSNWNQKFILAKVGTHSTMDNWTSVS